MIIKKEVIGFVFFVLFTFIIPSVFVVPMVMTNQSETIEVLSKQNTNLQSANHSLSQQLSITQDSLDASLSRDVLWLSRVVYSETNDPTEMYYVSHVVKNRVENCFRGKCNYYDVATDSWQFSGIHMNPRYYHQLNDSTATRPHDWVEAKQVALDVYLENQDPTNGATHFFSQVSMPNNQFPHWVDASKEITIDVLDPWRFRFYKL